MDMHSNNTVVTICDSNKKSLRELNSEKTTNGRKCKIFLPFESEYQFLIKNLNDTRILVNIDIDGTNITNDGLIVDKNSSSYLERFLNDAKKFKFVPKTNENVSDPTNPENGFIKVVIYKEKTEPKIDFSKLIEELNKKEKIFKDPPDWYKPYKPWPLYPNQPYDSDHWTFDNTRITCSATNYSEPPYSGKIKSPGVLTREFDNSGYSNGATIEGSHSNQTFVNSLWNGNDKSSKMEFIFILNGLDSKEHNEKLKQYLKLKEELGL